MSSIKYKLKSFFLAYLNYLIIMTNIATKSHKQKAEIEAALSEARDVQIVKLKKFDKEQKSLSAQQIKDFQEWNSALSEKANRLKLTLKREEANYSKQAEAIVWEIKNYDIVIFYYLGYSNFPSVKHREDIKNSIPEAKIKRLTDKIYLGK